MFWRSAFLFCSLVFAESEVIGELASDVINLEDKAAHLQPHELESMPDCSYFANTAESCDPFASYGTCRWCKTVKSMSFQIPFVEKSRVSLRPQQCPPVESIKDAYREQFYWHMSPTKYNQNTRVCVILPVHTKVHSYHASQKLNTGGSASGNTSGGKVPLSSAVIAGSSIVPEHGTETKKVDRKVLYISAGAAAGVVLIAMVICVIQK